MRAIIPDQQNILRASRRVASLSARKRGRSFFFLFFFTWRSSKRRDRRSVVATFARHSAENHLPITHLSLLISMQNKTSVFRYVSSAFIFAMFYGVSLITSLFSCSSTSNDESGDVVRFSDISTKMLRMISLSVYSCHNHAFYIFSFSLYFTMYM